METSITRNIGECRAVADADGALTLAGVVVAYNTPSDVGGMAEVIKAGAFGAIGDVILNRQHDRSRPLARTGSGLRLVDAADSLTMTATLTATQEAVDTHALVRDGVLRGLSVEMFVDVDSIVGSTRTIESARLVGIGVVDTPAYSDSVVATRSRRGFY